MINTKLEEFTSVDAINAGLIEAVKDGSAKISGTYEMQPNGVVDFNQNNFVFNDKLGALRVGRFKSSRDVIHFFLVQLFLVIATEADSSLSELKVENLQVSEEWNGIDRVDKK